MSGYTYVEVAILDPDGNPKRKFKIKGAGTFVEAINGEEYGIRVKNKGPIQQLGVLVYVDGKNVSRRSVKADETITITEVVTKHFIADGATKRIYRPLTFAYPEIKEAEDGTSLPEDVAERLGCIEIQVRELEECRPFPYRTPVLSQEALNVAMTEEEATSKGAFRSVTALGKHLGDVKLRYGSRAMLIFKGVPPQLWMNSNNNNTAADDDDDEQSDSDSEPRSGGRKRGRASGPLSLPPAGPPLNGQAANKRVKTEE